MKALLYRNIVILVYVFLLPLVGFAQRAGDLDTTFNPGTGSNSYISSSALQSNGKILIGGNFTSYNGTSRNYIACLNSDGSLDTTFNIGNGANSTVSTVTLQVDGKIIIGGLFSIFNGVSRNSIARLNTNGSLDETFNPGSGVRVNVSSIALQTDGKIIIGGVFSSFNGTPINRIARLNSNGSLDLSFNPGSGFNNEVTQVALQTDGKIVVVGGFTSFNGISINRIARLNANGSLDETFDSGIGADKLIASVAFQTNGKIILGGDFTTYNGISRNRIARINVDGSLDATFNPGNGVNESVRSISMQTDGKIVVGGYFTTYNGTRRNYLARINDNGVLDTTFNFGTDSFVYSITKQADSKMIIGGIFRGYSGFSTPGIARIHGLNFTSSSKKSTNSPKLNLYPNPTTGIVTLTTSPDAESITIINAIGQLVFTTEAQPEMELKLNHLAKGVYMVQVQSNRGVSTQRLVIQ